MSTTVMMDKNIDISNSTKVLAPFSKVPNIKNAINNINVKYGENLSSDDKDYIFIPTPIFAYNQPNSNGIAYVGKNEIKDSLNTAIGRPVIIDHNINDAIIIGVVVDAKAEDDAAFVLLAIDATKKETQDIIHHILDIPTAEFSISTYTDNFCCSICGTPIDKDPVTNKAICCQHLTNKVKFDKDGYIYCINYNTGAHIVKKDFHTIEVSLVSKGSEKCSHSSQGLML